MTRRPRLYFSFRSPFSWLLMTRLRRHVPDVFERMETIPYWEPDAETARGLRERDAEILYADMSKAKHLYILQDTKRLAAGLGLKIAWPVDVDPWWEVSHLGWLRARRQGRAVELYDAIVAARWERGENISDPAVVARLAASVGLDGDEIAGAPSDPDMRSEGVDCLARAYEDDVFGVPYLRLGWQRFWGYDRLDAFLEAYLGSGVAPAADPLAGVPAAVQSRVGAYDRDSAGGCG